jgi:hypothetical protein
MTQFPQQILYFTAQSGAYTASPGDNVLATAAAAWVLTLPANPARGACVSVRKVDAAAFAVTLKTTDGATIDGVAGATGVATGTSIHSGLEVTSDGTNWWITGT